MSEKERGKENLNLRFFAGTNKFDIPEIPRCESYTAQTFISFNYALTEKNHAHKGIHFFLDDYQFTRLWDNPTRYVELLHSYDCICAPDFSLYADYPVALQIYNHYRKMWLSAFYAEYGINVIPTGCWSDEASYDFCFEGMPTDSIVAISNTGAVHGKYQSQLFENGFLEMLKRIYPKKILVYGNQTEFLSGFDNIEYIGNSHNRFEAL